MRCAIEDYRRTAKAARRHNHGDRAMASGNDMKSHNSTYTGFLGMLKWGTAVTIAVTALVILLIA
ncbi:aa3-type cytochrome c oxidase subunit IV [Novosphingobium kunmingense]|nr:aa3-type cytochrome c oxidase subunit IV [Novosphingobium kunmingense]